MAPRNQYQMNYARLEALIGQPLGDLWCGRSCRLRAQEFMDLVVEVLPQDAGPRDDGARLPRFASEIQRPWLPRIR